MKLILFSLFLFSSLFLKAQQSVQPDGGGAYDMSGSVHDDMSPQRKAAIIKMLKKNVAMLRKKGLLPLTNKPEQTGFQWPLMQSSGFNDYGVYFIANYIDEDNTSGTLDYNCGTRTYDGHQGTDIALWPFPWKKWAESAVTIVAAAPGTIIAKEDGLIDTSCAACPACNWNAVYIMQADGSMSWYGHMKKNSVTAKAVGQTVALGEYLGLVGSSGSSTAPHLHFQVWTDNTYTHLIDPWAGNCNSFNGLTSWWANQQPYHVPTLNMIMTHYPQPAMPGCKSGEAFNGKVNFVNGEQVYCATYFRDQEAGTHAYDTIYRPDSTVFATWMTNLNVYSSASWYYFIRTLPNPAPTGLWRYRVAYNGQPTLTTYFAVNELAYIFTGNGSWDVASNWCNDAMPPAVLPSNSEILIAPVAGGECVLSHTETINNGAKISVNPGCHFRVTGNLQIL